MPLPYGWGTGGIQVTAAIIGPRRRAEGDRPGRRRHDQRRHDPPLLRLRPPSVATTTRTQRGHRHPDAPPHPGDAAQRGPDPRLSRCRSPSRCACWSRARPRPAPCTRSPTTASMQVRLYERHRAARPHRQDLQLPGAGERALHDEPLAHPQVRQSQARPQPGPAALRRRPREAHLRRAALHAGQEPRLRRPSVRDRDAGSNAASCAAPRTASSTR